MLRYYVYISDAKIDIFLPQIPSSRQQKITREIGIDWKILYAKRTAEYDTEQHRFIGCGLLSHTSERTKTWGL
jgi:Family of unknown function (DUF7019)